MTTIYTNRELNITNEKWKKKDQGTKRRTDRYTNKLGNTIK